MEIFELIVFFSLMVGIAVCMEVVRVELGEQLDDELSEQLKETVDTKSDYQTDLGLNSELLVEIVFLVQFLQDIANGLNIDIVGLVLEGVTVSVWMLF